MINVESTYPENIDPLGYFSDVTLAQKDIMDQYNDLIEKHNYTEAYKLVSESPIFGWFADYLNAIENRIHATQVYLTDTYLIHHPDQNLYDETEPTIFKDQNKERELAVGDVWISTAE